MEQALTGQAALLVPPSPRKYTFITVPGKTESQPGTPHKYLTPQILSTVSICTDDGANVVKTAWDWTLTHEPSSTSCLYRLVHHSVRIMKLLNIRGLQDFSTFIKIFIPWGCKREVEYVHKIAEMLGRFMSALRWLPFSFLRHDCQGVQALLCALTCARGKYMS